LLAILESPCFYHWQWSFVGGIWWDSKGIVCNLHLKKKEISAHAQKGISDIIHYH